MRCVLIASTFLPESSVLLSLNVLTKSSIRLKLSLRYLAKGVEEGKQGANENSDIEKDVLVEDSKEGAKCSSLTQDYVDILDE